MENVLLINILAWTGIVVLFILCLPAARISKFILEICAFGLRLLLLAALAGGIALWFQPEMVPSTVVAEFETLPAAVQENVPPPGTPLFGLMLAGITILMYLPALAILDVTRKLAGTRLLRLRDMTQPETVIVSHTNGKHVYHRYSNKPRVEGVEGSNVHSAADTMTSARRKPAHRVSDYVN